MNLNLDDIYDRVESFRKHHNYSQEKMAEFMGLRTKQAYSNMIKKKTMKLRYLVNLTNNSGQEISNFFETTTKEQPYQAGNSLGEVAEPDIKIISCMDCIGKQKEIDALKIALEAKEELLALYRGKKKAAS